MISKANGWIIENQIVQMEQLTDLIKLLSEIAATLNRIEKQLK